jgi:hypothetical protein
LQIRTCSYFLDDGLCPVLGICIFSVAVHIDMQ